MMSATVLRRVNLCSQNIRTAFLLLAIAFTCTGNAYAKPAKAQSGPECQYENVSFTARFDGGRLNECFQKGKRHFVLTITPEATPINPSPWYAFDVTTKSERDVKITLEYGDFWHRYDPKIWTEETGWQALPSKLKVHDDGKRATFKIKDLDGTLRIAAQPIILPSDTNGWLKALANHDQAEFQNIGESAQGRNIFALKSGQDLDHWLLLIGRQHPPETTGAVAMKAFVERLYRDESMANEFRQKVGLVTIPMLNPDGVIAGNWRLESSGLDLNRDWGPFTRPESQLVRDLIAEKIDAGQSLIAGLDFHSTRRDILYTQPDSPEPKGMIVKAWHEAINERLVAAGHDPIVRDANHNSEKPTFKTWINVAYDIPGVTVELGDKTDFERINLIGEIAAEELMRLLID
ncbi:M14 family metallopeptidase [Hyphococcus sp. DH-69]|uniref:M14 family metallopeptidase n=1 Tax=Hyphococcus formosus TaxID=3143534 RepID=UPI00398A520B